MDGLICRALRHSLLCLVLLLSNPALSHARDTSRLPPSVSHQQTLQLFAQQRYDEAYAAAVHRFEWGDDRLHYPIGYMQRHGLGTSTNLLRAREHLLIAAQRNHARAQYQLAEMLRLGEGGSINSRQACSWYHRARNSQSNAAFQAAQCDLSDGRKRAAIKQFHSLASQGHLGASKRLLLHYRQNGRSDILPTSDYTQAVAAWLEQDDARAQKHAQAAIKQGDYRAYAVLGESARRKTGHNAELLKQQVELGRLFGSQLPRYASGLRLQQQGYTGAACKFFAQAMQGGFKHAGRQMGQCLEKGLVQVDKPGKTACDYYQQAFFSGDASSTQKWLQCLSGTKPDALQLAKTYDQAKQLDAKFNDTALADKICQSLPERTLAVGTRVTPGDGQPHTVDIPLNACVLQQSGKDFKVFVPLHGWYIALSSFDFTLPVTRHGLLIDNIKRDRLRWRLQQRDAVLERLDLSHSRDVLRPKSTDKIEIRLHYTDSGKLKRYVETCKFCLKDNFTWRRQRLQEHFGPPLSSTSSDSFEDRRWQTYDWDIQLMFKPQDGQMREIYSARNR